MTPFDSTASAPSQAPLVERPWPIASRIGAVQSAARQLSLFSAIDEPDYGSAFAVRESGRARRLSIKVSPRGRVEVVVPKRTRAAEVREFVEANRDWIRQARASFAAEHEPEPFALPDVVRLIGIGSEFSVRYEPAVDANQLQWLPLTYHKLAKSCSDPT